MTIEYQLTIDCADPGRLVAFWASALGYVPKPPPDGYATWRDYYLSINIPAEELGDGDCIDRLIDPAGRAPGIWFQPVPEGKVVKNRLHLDIRVGTGLVGDERVAVLEEECSRLVALGATRVRLLVADEENESCLVMQDVEGNEFCLA